MYVALCYAKLDYYDVSSEILQVLDVCSLLLLTPKPLSGVSTVGSHAAACTDLSGLHCSAYTAGTTQQAVVMLSVTQLLFLLW